MFKYVTYRKVLVVFLILALGSVGYWWLIRSDSGVIELTKEEALRIMDLQTQFMMIQADRNEFLQALYRKYALTPETHNLDLRAGRFVPVPPPKKEVNK